MIILYSLSGGCEKAAEKYIQVFRDLGQEPARDDICSVSEADAYFVCLAGDDNKKVKDTLNLVLDRKIPVAYCIENDVEPDIGLKMQLGLARQIRFGTHLKDIGEWLKDAEQHKKKAEADKKKRIFAIIAALVIVAAAAVGLLIKHNKDAAAEAERMAALAAQEEAARQEAELINGQKPEDITVLDMSGQELSDIAFLANAVNLEELDLSDNEISDISSLAGLEKLKKLDLSNNNIKDINVLLALPALEELDISDNPLENSSALDFMEGVEIIRD